MKRLLLCGVVALSLVGIMFIAQADEVVRYDRHGNPYVHKGHGPIAGSFAKIFTGSNREYLPREDVRREVNDGLMRPYNQGNPNYFNNNYRR